jgi:subtilisin family serine protease
MKWLRRIFIGALVVVIIGAAGAGAYWLWTQFGNTTTNVTALPTHTPAPNETPDNAPAITSSDDCEAVASAASVAVNVDSQRNTRFRSLLNIRPTPTTEPTQIDIPESVGSNLAFVQFTPDSARRDRIAYVRSIRGIPLRQIEEINTYLVSLPDDVDASNLPSSPIVLVTEPDRLAAALQDFGSLAPASNSNVASPINDPRYGEQWGLPVMGIPSAWSSLAADAPIITVAVIDSGICGAHADLQGKVVAGWDFVDYDNDPNDEYGHGCGVAGIIAASNNNGVGIAGIAPNARIMPLRVLDHLGLGKYSSIANAIIYAADNGAQIINMSLAGPNESAIVSDAIDYAIERGVTIIAASGNAGDTRVWFPASHPSVVAVGSIDQSLEMSSFTNHDDNLDILAPGRNILTTNMLGDYELMTGTSFASPHVAGAAALTLALDTTLNTDSGIIFTYPPNSQLRCQ